MINPIVKLIKIKIKTQITNNKISDLLDMSDFKEKNAVLKIQFALKLNNCIKNLEKFQNINLDKLGSTVSFNEFKSVITNPDVINITKNFSNTLESFKSGLKINPKIIISAYLIVYYTDELIGGLENRHPIDQQIINQANQVVSELKLTKINNIWTILSEFKFMFLKWSQMDKARTIEKLIVSYYYRTTHIEKINGETLDLNQKIQLLQELKRQQKEIIQSIKLIDKNFNIRYLEENYVQIFEQIQKSWEQLKISVAKTMKQAYFDMLSTDISNGNLISSFTLLKEIAQRLEILCLPTQVKLIEEKFSDDNLTEILFEAKFTNQLINFINFIIDLIIQLDAPESDKLNIQWKSQINQLVKLDFSKSFPIILIEIEEHIDHIYKLILDLA